MKRKIPWALRVALALGLGVIMFVYLRGRIPSDQDLRRQRTIESIEAISSAYQDYVGDNGSMPEELNNFKVTEAMLGANGSTKMYVSMSPGDMNGQGEMVDEWGTPYRISYVSAKIIRIISAGPDKTFGTPDDLTNK